MSSRSPSRTRSDSPTRVFCICAQPCSPTAGGHVRVDSSDRIHALPKSFWSASHTTRREISGNERNLSNAVTSDSNVRWSVPVSDTNLISPVEEVQKPSSSSLLLSSAAFVGGLVEGACAILVASASAKLFVGLGAVAGAVKASRLHADIVRVPVLLVSAASAVITLVVLWNSWRARNRPAARWRKKPMTLREKFSFAITLLASVLTMALVVGEVIEHPIFHVH